MRLKSSGPAPLPAARPNPFSRVVALNDPPPPGSAGDHAFCAALPSGESMSRSRSTRPLLSPMATTRSDTAAMQLTAPTEELSSRLLVQASLNVLSRHTATMLQNEASDELQSQET